MMTAQIGPPAAAKNKKSRKDINFNQLDSEIKEIIENFIWHTVNSLGVEIDQVYLEWG